MITKRDSNLRGSCFCEKFKLTGWWNATCKAIIIISNIDIKGDFGVVLQIRALYCDSTILRHDFDTI